MLLYGKEYKHSRALKVIQDYQMVNFIPGTDRSNYLHKVLLDYTDTTTLGCSWAFKGSRDGISRGGTSLKFKRKAYCSKCYGPYYKICF